MLRAKRLLRAGLRNRATTWLGIGAVLVALGAYITAWADGDPTTTPDLDPVIELLVIGLLGAQGIAARDANKSTEQSMDG